MPAPQRNAAAPMHAGMMVHKSAAVEFFCLIVSFKAVTCYTDLSDGSGDPCHRLAVNGYF